ncbi:hypothetical protein [Capnocytophaga canimorsus]|uniref:hypothetical protein n=1 Tax=Capnocytophaga canimorsus TaxID=28188 RepID=UPI00385BF215
MKKRILSLLLFVFSAFLWGQSKNDTEKVGLKGKVKSVEITLYQAFEENGSVKKKAPLEQGIYDEFRLNQFRLLHRLGAIKHFVDFLGQIIPCYITYNQDGNITTLVAYPKTDREYHKSFQYKDNQIIKQQTHDSEGTILEITSYEYDSQNRLTKEVFENKRNDGGVIWKYRYNDKNQITESDYYDIDGTWMGKEIYEYENGNLVRKITRNDNGQPFVTASYTYNSEQKLIRIDFEAKNNFTHLSTFTYNENYLSEEKMLIGNNNGILTKYNNNQEITSQITLSTNEEIIFQYTYDDKENWITMTTFEFGKPSRIVERKIAYYP